MQGSKLPLTRLWIAGVSSVAILVGCESEPVKETANTNAMKVENSAASDGQTQKPDGALLGGQVEEVAPQAAVAPPAAAVPPIEQGARLRDNKSSALAAPSTKAEVAPYFSGGFG